VRNHFGFLLSKYITKIKGSAFEIDRRVSGGYLLGVVMERCVMKVRGVLAFPTRGDKPFIGARSTVKSKRHLTFGPGVTFGVACYVDALSVNGVRLGANTSIGRNTRIECTGSLRHLGQGFTAGNNVGLGTDNLYGCAGGIAIGHDTIVGNFVTFHAENHRTSDLETPIRLQGVTHLGITVGTNCWIGAKATVLDGAHIGHGCIIAAGSVVLAGEYPANAIYGGVPARWLRSRCESDQN